jgi:hypothetical protein
MVRIAGHRHMRDQTLGGDPTFDQPRRGRFLNDDAFARPAGKLRTACHDHPILYRDHIEPFRFVLADHRHLCPAARARRVVRRQRDLDPRQMGRQRTPARTALGGALLAQCRVTFLRLGLPLEDRLFEIFKSQLPVILRQALGLSSEPQAIEYPYQMLLPFDRLQQLITFRHQRVALGLHRQHQRTQCVGIGRQILRFVASGVHRVRILRSDNRFVNRSYCLNTRPIETVEQRSEFHRRQLHHPVHYRWPPKGILLKLLPDQHQAAWVPDQDLQPVGTLCAEHDDHPRKRILAQHLRGQRRERMCPFSKINRPGRHQHPGPRGDTDHRLPDELRTARSTAVNKSLSTPGATRTTAPASSISIPDWLLTTSAVTGLPSLSETIGTNAGTESRVGSGSRNAAALPAFLA